MVRMVNTNSANGEEWNEIKYSNDTNSSFLLVFNRSFNFNGTYKLNGKFAFYVVNDYLCFFNSLLSNLLIRHHRWWTIKQDYIKQMRYREYTEWNWGEPLITILEEYSVVYFCYKHIYSMHRCQQRLYMLKTES